MRTVKKAPGKTRKGFWLERSFVAEGTEAKTRTRRVLFRETQTVVGIG